MSKRYFAAHAVRSAGGTIVYHHSTYFDYWAPTFCLDILGRARLVDYGYITNVSPSDIEVASKLTSIDGLSLSGNHLSDEILAKLVMILGLKDLSLADSNLDDYYIRQIPKLGQLQKLRISNTMIGSDGLAYIANNCMNLHTLHINGIHLEDEGIEAIAHIPTLRVLGIAGTNINKRQLESLLVPGHIQVVYLRDTAISDDDIRDLKAKFPQRELRRN